MPLTMCLLSQILILLQTLYLSIWGYLKYVIFSFGIRSAYAYYMEVRDHFSSNAQYPIGCECFYEIIISICHAYAKNRLRIHSTPLVSLYHQAVVAISRPTKFTIIGIYLFTPKLLLVVYSILFIRIFQFLYPVQNVPKTKPTKQQISQYPRFAYSTHILRICLYNLGPTFYLLQNDQ